MLKVELKERWSDGNGCRTFGKEIFRSRNMGCEECRIQYMDILVTNASDKWTRNEWVTCNSRHTDMTTTHDERVAPTMELCHEIMKHHRLGGGWTVGNDGWLEWPEAR